MVMKGTNKNILKKTCPDFTLSTTVLWSQISAVKDRRRQKRSKENKTE
jgi:hypothetical protein